MAGSAQASKTDCITLSSTAGSAAIVCEYLDFAISTILFQRGIRPQYEFNTTTHYDLTLFKLKDGYNQQWIKGTLAQVQTWINEKKLIKFFLVIKNSKTKENLERWEFAVEDDSSKETAKEGEEPAQPGKTLKRIQLEIREVMRQISATVSFLPFLDCPCDFTLAVRCVPGTVFPPGWGPCDVSVKNSQQSDLKTFGTGYHGISTCVHYKN